MHVRDSSMSVIGRSIGFRPLIAALPPHDRLRDCLITPAGKSWWANELATPKYRESRDLLTELRRLWKTSAIHGRMEL